MDKTRLGLVILIGATFGLVINLSLLMIADQWQQQLDEFDQHFQSRRIR